MISSLKSYRMKTFFWSHAMPLLSRSTRKSTSRPRWEQQLYPIIAPTQYKRKKNGITSKGKLDTNIRITMCKMRFWILDVKAVLTLQGKLKTNRELRLFHKITDVSSKQLSSFCLRPVNENLNAVKDFIGFYQLKDFKNNSIVHVHVIFLLE